MTRVVNVRDEPCEVYIGRPSPWGNPFYIGRDGTRKQVIERYRAHILASDIDLESLRGKVLGCWCKPQACHGDVLVELLEGLQ